jgi:hypothetical protein
MTVIIEFNSNETNSRIFQRSELEASPRRTICSGVRGITTDLLHDISDAETDKDQTGKKTPRK